MTTTTQPGAVLAGRYRLESQRGDSLPDVEHWRARDQVLDRPVELYLLRGGDVDAALDAARRAALVSDPRLVRVLDVGHEDTDGFVVTEKVGGRSLAELVSRGPIPHDQARGIVGELAVALETARRRGVHHLALRPSAVYVEPSGAVLLTGLAVEGALLGLDQADARATTRADAVALVQLLYAGLTAHWPGAASGDALALPPAPVVDGATVPPAELAPDVPNDLDTLCAVTFGPHEDGPHSPAELAADLEPWPAVRGAQLIAAAGLADEDAPAPTVAPAPVAPTSVRRQSVRQRTGAPSTQPPGTPPPARPAPSAFPPAPPPAPQAAAASPPVVGTYVPAAAAQPPFDARPASSAPAPRRGRAFNATPFVLTLVLGAVVVGAVLAFQSFLAPVGPASPRPEPTVAGASGEPSEPADSEPAPEPSQSEELPPAVIAAGRQLDPDGDGDEHPEAVDLAFDGDMSTFWFTRTYNQPDMPGKSGLGYEITLAEKTMVSGLTLYINGDGGEVEVRATKGNKPTNGPVLASDTMSPETVLFFNEPVETKTLVLWFTELPQTPDGRNRVELLEIEFD